MVLGGFRSFHVLVTTIRVLVSQDRHKEDDISVSDI